MGLEIFILDIVIWFLMIICFGFDIGIFGCWFIVGGCIVDCKVFGCIWFLGGNFVGGIFCVGFFGGMVGCCCFGKGLGFFGVLVCVIVFGFFVVGVRFGRGSCGGIMLGVIWGGFLKLVKKIVVIFWMKFWYYWNLVKFEKFVMGVSWVN